MNEEQARKFAESVELPAPTEKTYSMSFGDKITLSYYTDDQIRDIIAAALVKATQPGPAKAIIPGFALDSGEFIPADQLNSRGAV